MTWQIFEGDCRAVLRELPAGMVQTCVTSPPYFGLRDYGTGQWEGGAPACSHAKVRDRVAAVASSTLNGGKATTGHIQEGYGRICGRCGATRIDQQIGLEPTPDEFVAALVAVFREVRRVLRDDGTVWLNLGDSYAANRTYQVPSTKGGAKHSPAQGFDGSAMAVPDGMKPKDLIGIPWMVAFALRADGWYLRSDIIWSKPNPMPESVTDRPTKAHEYLFLLSKSARYFYDADAIREPHITSGDPRNQAGYEPIRLQVDASIINGGARRTTSGASTWPEAGRNKRSVWTVATQPYNGAHFATFPPKLIEPCILAGSSPKACGDCGAPWRRIVERTPMVVEPSERRNGFQADHGELVRTQTGGTMTQAPSSVTIGWEPSCGHHVREGRSVVLDPFAGSGTTGVVAAQHGRDFVGCELNQEYAAMARERILIEGKPGARNHEPPAVHENQLGLIV